MHEGHAHVVVPTHGLSGNLKGAFVAVERDDTPTQAAGGGFLDDELGDQAGAGSYVQVYEWVGHSGKQPGDQVTIDLAIFRNGREMAEMKVTHARDATFVCSICSLQGMAYPPERGVRRSTERRTPVWRPAW